MIFRARERSIRVNFITFQHDSSANKFSNAAPSDRNARLDSWLFPREISGENAVSPRRCRASLRKLLRIVAKGEQLSLWFCRCYKSAASLDRNEASLEPNEAPVLTGDDLKYAAERIDEMRGLLFA
jgi:hypothetical protein